MTYDMSFTPVLIWFFLLKDIIYEFLSFGMIYRLVYNFLKLRLLMLFRLEEETQMYKPLTLEWQTLMHSTRTVI